MLKRVKWAGKPIARAGIYTGIPLPVYHSQLCTGPSVSSSGLRRCFALSPAHFYAQWSGNPDCIEQEDKKHFVIGRAVHHLMLGERFFSKSFAVRPKQWADWRTTDSRMWRDATEAKGLTVLTLDDIEAIRGMAESLSKNPIVRAGALNGDIETSTFWKDKGTGLWIKIRPDAIPTTSVDFVDLKTTTSVIWPDLQRAIAEHGYHQQGALVRMGAREVLGIDHPTFSLVFIEKTKPHCVRVVTLKDNDLDRGERANRYALDAIARCIKSKHWPGPGGEREDAENIELPEWAQKQADEKIQYGVS
jgi:PDDEXK-like domain of unknown function (DUF3799)